MLLRIINSSMTRTITILAASVLFAVITVSAALAGELVINPDPFDPARGTTRICYTMESNSDVALYIFGPNGRLVLKKEVLSGSNGGRAGNNEVEWNGKSEYGDLASTGNYMVRVIKLDKMKVVGSGRIAVIEGYSSGSKLGGLFVLLIVMTGLVAATGTMRIYGVIKKRK